MDFEELISGQENSSTTVLIFDGPSGGETSDSSSSPKTNNNGNSVVNGLSQKTCRVCGDTALNMNFGAVSCESCKAFFRRNALKKKVNQNDKIRLASSSIEWLADWLVDWSIDCMTDQLSDWLIDWFIAWLIDPSLDWLIDWLIDWLVHFFRNLNVPSRMSAASTWNPDDGVSNADWKNALTRAWRRSWFKKGSEELAMWIPTCPSPRAPPVYWLSRSLCSSQTIQKIHPVPRKNGQNYGTIQCRPPRWKDLVRWI